MPMEHKARRPAAALLALLLAVALALVAPAAPAAAQGSPLWGELEPGPFQVGFRTLYARDSTRPWLPVETGPDAVEGRPARPVRISIWYPAVPAPAARPMMYRDYVELPAPPPGFEALDRALAARNLAALRQMVRAPDALATLFATPTAAYRDAPPRPGRYALVVYLSGLNESGQHANHVLAEYLASRGIVVAAPAQVGTSPARLRLGINPVDLETQVRDVEFAAAALRALSFVGPRWAIVGHSMGGIVGLVTQARNPDLAAIVGLDASWGSAGLQASLTGSPFFRPERMRVPLLDLRRADPPADFSLLEALLYSDRRIGEYPGIAHGDFTSFPMIAALVPTDIQGRTPEVARRGYVHVVRAAADFLEATLDGSRDDVRAARAREDGVVRWRTLAALPAPPTEEAVARMIVGDGVEAALAAWRRLPSGAADRPLLNERLLLSLGYDHLEAGADPRAAAQIFRFLTEIRPGSADYLDSLAEAYIASGEAELARQACLRVLAALDADASLGAGQKAQLRETAIERLSELGAAPPAAGPGN
jgi:pimeloyl-ACP methyl ester carboxylesterase